MEHAMHGSLMINIAIYNMEGEFLATMHIYTAV